jgi:hypothetical protein
MAFILRMPESCNSRFGTAAFFWQHKLDPIGICGINTLRAIPIAPLVLWFPPMWLTVSAQGNPAKSYISHACSSQSV